MNSRADWSRLFELLDSALELDPEARETWLQHLTDVPPELKERLRQLLAERQRLEEEEFLARPHALAEEQNAQAAASRVAERAPRASQGAAEAARPAPGTAARPGPPQNPARSQQAAGAAAPTPEQIARARAAMQARAKAAAAAQQARPTVGGPAAGGSPGADVPTGVRNVSKVVTRSGGPKGPPQVGMVLKDGRYTLVQELGQGGMGKVFKARDQRRVEADDRNPYVAFKVIGEDFKPHPDAHIALQREGKRAQALAHPNVITVHDYDRDGALVFMTMEYLEGNGLDVHLRTDYAAGLSVTAAWPIIRGIGAALEYGHSKKIIHCDMKPSNVFICKDGGVKVLDFGIARPMATKDEGNVTRFDPGKRLGGLTPAYASLEMWNRDEPDPRDDIYAFACVVYQLLSGKHPFDGRSAKIVRDEKLKPKRIDSISRVQWDALRKGLALHRDQRTPTVSQFIAPFAPSTFLRRHGVSVASVSGIVALAALTLGAHYYRTYVEDELIGFGSDAVEEGPAVPLTPAQKQDVEDKLTLAQEFFAGVQVDMPADELISALSEGANNVNGILVDVLATDRGNTEARRLQGKIADMYAHKARTLLKAGDVSSADALVDAGLRVRPKNKDLFRLQRDICKANPATC